MTLWQCAVVLAACTPHFPDLVSVAAHLWMPRCRPSRSSSSSRLRLRNSAGQQAGVGGEGRDA